MDSRLQLKDLFWIVILSSVRLKIAMSASSNSVIKVMSDIVK